MSQRRSYTPAELAEKDAVDLLRTLVRFKARRNIRHELNELEPQMLERLADGDEFRFGPDEILGLASGE